MKLVHKALNILKPLHGNKKIDKWWFHEQLFNTGHKDDYIIGTDKKIRDYYPKRNDMRFVDRVFSYQAHATRTDGKISVAKVREIAIGVGGTYNYHSSRTRGKGLHNKEKTPKEKKAKTPKDKKPPYVGRTKEENQRVKSYRYYASKIERYHKNIEGADQLIGEHENEITSIIKNAFTFTQGIDIDLIDEGNLKSLKSKVKELKKLTGATDAMEDDELQLAMAANNPINTSYFYDSKGTRHKFDAKSSAYDFFGGLLARAYKEHQFGDHKEDPTLDSMHLAIEFNKAFLKQKFWKQNNTQFDRSVFAQNAAMFMKKKEQARLQEAVALDSQYKNLSKNNPAAAARAKNIAQIESNIAEYQEQYNTAKESEERNIKLAAIKKEHTAQVRHERYLRDKAKKTVDNTD